MSYAVLCPGQGAQNAQMLELVADHPRARAVFDRAAQVLGEDLRAWLHQGDDLFRNVIAQPLICVYQYAIWAALRDQLPAPAAIAGYSVGELASYACADAFDGGALAWLARERARIMDKDAGDRPSGLVAIRGLCRGVIEALCARHEAWVAIVMGEDAIVIGGTQAALDVVKQEVGRRGAQVTCLRVGVASHTPLLERAVKEFRSVLERSSIAPPKVPIVAGIDASLVWDRARAIDTLSRQIAATVEWAQCMDSLYERGCRVYLELGPGSALSRKVCERYADVESRAVGEFRSLAAVVEWVRHRTGDAKVTAPG